MSESSDVSQRDQFAAEALWAARVASVLDPSSNIPRWVESAGAEHVELWEERNLLSESGAREVTQHAHAIIIDLDVGPARAFQLASMIAPSCGVLFTSESIDAATCRKIDRAHWGYRSKQTSQGDFLLALRRLTRLYVPDLARLTAHAVQLWSLSPQQARVLHYNLWSYCDQDIANALDVSIHTVQEYQDGLRRKSGARSKQGYLARLLEVSGNSVPPLAPSSLGARRLSSSATLATAHADREHSSLDDLTSLHAESRALLG